MAHALQYRPDFFRALWLTLWISLAAFALALVCGLAAALARNSSFLLLRLGAGCTSR